MSGSSKSAAGRGKTGSADGSTAGATSTAKSTGHGDAFTALTAQISTKLSSSEMKGVLQMAERIRRLEITCNQLNEAKEDTESRLHATESVKEFLVGKLKDTEMALKRTIDNANDSSRQHQADQEVINFLDSRVQELEQQLRTAVAAKETADTSLRGLEGTSGKQIATLEDMLQYEKDRCARQEQESKAQKKLLVKEVKTLRSQVASLKTERAFYKNQLEDFKTKTGHAGGMGQSSSERAT